MPQRVKGRFGHFARGVPSLTECAMPRRWLGKSRVREDPSESLPRACLNLWWTGRGIRGDPANRLPAGLQDNPRTALPEARKLAARSSSPGRTTVRLANRPRAMSAARKSARRAPSIVRQVSSRPFRAFRSGQHAPDFRERERLRRFSPRCLSLSTMLAALLVTSLAFAQPAGMCVASWTRDPVPRESSFASAPETRQCPRRERSNIAIGFLPKERIEPLDDPSVTGNGCRLRLDSFRVQPRCAPIEKSDSASSRDWTPRIRPPHYRDDFRAASVVSVPLRPTRAAFSHVRQICSACSSCPRCRWI